jgi:hypothetical protein
MLSAGGCKRIANGHEIKFYWRRVTGSYLILRDSLHLGTRKQRLYTRRIRMRERIPLVALIFAFLLALVPFTVGSISAQPTAVIIYGVTVSNKLITFNSSDPGTIMSTNQISGLQANENVLGIDFRPATGQLYGLGSTSRLYTIDIGSGAATQVGSVLTTTLQGTDFGFDFNPLVDRIRVTSNEDQNLRLNPNNGTIAGIDGTLAYSTTDRNASQNPNIVASAYTNNVPGPASTTLYNIDTNLDVLVTQNPPNAGTLNTVGPLGEDITSVTGFDIVGSNTAFASLSFTNNYPANTTGLYSVNLTTGAITPIRFIGGGEAVRDISAALSAAPATVTPVPPTATAGPPPPSPTPCPGGVVNTFTASASGSQEVPPTNSQATGSGTFTYDPAAGTITYNFNIQGSLTSTETMAHLHRGAPGVNGPVIVPLPVGASKSGTAPFPAEEVANLRAGNFYINVHTTQFPGGEIRGQLVGQCPGAGTPVVVTPVAGTPTTAPTTAATQPAAPTATVAPIPPMPTEVLPPAPTPAPPVVPGMPSTGGGDGTFFFLLLALTGLAALMVGLISRRPAKR